MRRNLPSGPPIRLPGFSVAPDGTARLWPPPAEERVAVAESEVAELREELTAQRRKNAGLQRALLQLAENLDADSGVVTRGLRAELVELVGEPEGVPEGTPEEEQVR